MEREMVIVNKGRNIVCDISFQPKHRLSFLKVFKRSQRIIFLRRIRKELKVPRGLSYILGRNKAIL